MQQNRDLAITLRSVAFEERHKIVTALTEQHGQVSALARNSIQSRRFGGALEPFAASEWFYVEKPGSELWRLDQAQIRRPFEGLRRDFEKLSLASAFNELMIKVAPVHEPCPALFKLLANSLAYLDESSRPGADLSLLNAFLIKILLWSGNQPRLDACLQCDLPLEALEPDAPVTCLVTEAGWICPACRTSQTRHLQQSHEGTNLAQLLLRVTPAALTDLRDSQAPSIRNVPAMTRASRREHQELFRFVEALFVYHMPGFDRLDQRPIKSLRFLDLESTVPLQAASPR